MTSLASLETLLDPSSTTGQVVDTTPAPAPSEVAEPVVALTETEPPETPEATAEETGETPPQPAAAPPPAAPGRTPTVPTKQGATPASDDEDLPRDVKGVRAAAKAERERRKAAEQREQETARRFADVESRLREADGNNRQMAAYLEAVRQYAPPPGQPQEQRPQIPDVFTHPEERLAFERAQYAEALQQQEQRLGNSMHQQVYATRVLLGQEVMRTKHADYDEMEAIGTQVAEQNPQLKAEILRHPNPAAHIYEVGKRIKMNHEVRQAGGWDNYYQQQVESEVQRRLAAHQQPPAPAVPAVRAPAAQAAPNAQPTARAPTAPPPQSLAGVTSAAPRRAPAWNGPQPLDDILQPK